MKKGIFFVAALLFTALALFTPATAYALEIFFEHRDVEEISRGVVFERNRMMTSRGMLDVHVLTVDVNQPYITLAPVTSATAPNLRETTSRMLSDAGAIGGVNADFFNMASLYSIYFGAMVQNGEPLSLNARASSFATFILDMQNNAFFEYMTTTMRLYSGGSRLFDVMTYNNVGPTLESPAILSRAAMDDTSALVERFPRHIQFVVENGRVARFAAAGVGTEIPENGFVIFMPRELVSTYSRQLLVGSSVYLYKSTNLNIDFSDMQAAIGGGAIILDGGEFIPNRGVEPNRRHPRTAIGATADGRIILMTVDGRTHSIGATHEELGFLLRRYGAVDAMHFDGGGSTTMVVEGRVANTLSDGSQRRVTNALGIFDRSVMGAPMGIAAVPAQPRAVVGVPMPVEFFAHDSLQNKIPLNAEELSHLQLFASHENGFWENGRYTPLRAGVHFLEVQLGNFHAVATVYAYSLAELLPQHDVINLLEGNRVRLNFHGTAVDGTHVVIPEVPHLSVSPAYLGVFENGHFIAARGGAGYISAALGAVRAYIPVTVGGFPWGIALDTPMPGEPIALRLQVFGDESGYRIRARITDANGGNHTIDLGRSTFEGWQTITAALPNAPAPLTLTRVYMLDGDDTRLTVTFQNTEALYAANADINVPQGTAFHDRLRANPDFDGFPGGAFHQFVIPETHPFEVFGTGRIAVARLSAQGGGIQAANIDQWQRLMPMLRAINLPYVVLILDEAPSSFSRRMEAELLHLAATQLRDEGFLVFVVYSAEETALTIRDNIRYIASSTGAIRFWTYSGGLRWSE